MLKSLPMRLFLALAFTWVLVYGLGCAAGLGEHRPDQGPFDRMPDLLAQVIALIGIITRTSPFDYQTHLIETPGKLFATPIGTTVTLDPIGFAVGALAPIAVVGVLFLVWSWALARGPKSPN